MNDIQIIVRDYIADYLFEDCNTLAKHSRLRDMLKLDNKQMSDIARKLGDLFEIDIDQNELRHWISINDVAKSIETATYH